MKDVIFVIEVTSHILANSANSDGNKDQFQRDSTGAMIFQQAWWYSAFSRAMELAKVRGIKPADINMNLSVNAATELYKRRYGKDQYRTHEAIVPGTRVKFEAVVADHVTQSTLAAILEKMGKYVGLSPYGYRLGFGKFNVISVKVAASDGSTDDELDDTIGNK